MKDQIEWKDNGISITYPINERHTKGAMAYLLSENQTVTMAAVKTVLPELLYNLGNDFYNNAWYQNHHDQVEKLYQEIFPEDHEEIKPNDFMLYGVPSRYFGFLALIAAPTILTGSIVPFFLVLFLGWITGFILARKNPYFFSDFIKGKTPWIYKKMFPVALLVVLSFVTPSNSFALFGVGDIVSDPGSYSYYVEQIKVATENFEKVKEQLETAQKALDEVQKTRQSLEGAYNHATGTIEDLQRIQKEISENPAAMLKYANKFMEKEGSGEWENAEDIIKEIFIDPRKIDNQIDRFKDINKKYHLRQKNLEQAINEAEKVHASMPERYAAIEEMAKKIDSTENLKSSSDLGNQLLAEILKAINDLVSLTAYIGEAQAMVNFKGAEYEETVQAEKDLEAAQEASKGYQPQREYLDAQGVNLENNSDDEMMRTLDKY